jgi:hypothetical protein
MIPGKEKELRKQRIFHEKIKGLAKVENDEKFKAVSNKF